MGREANAGFPMESKETNVRATATHGILLMQTCSVKHSTVTLAYKSPRADRGDDDWPIGQADKRSLSVREPSTSLSSHQHLIFIVLVLLQINKRPPQPKNSPLLSIYYISIHPSLAAPKQSTTLQLQQASGSRHTYVHLIHRPALDRQQIKDGGGEGEERRRRAADDGGAGAGRGAVHGAMVRDRVVPVLVPAAGRPGHARHLPAAGGRRHGARAQRDVEQGQARLHRGHGLQGRPRQRRGQAQGQVLPPALPPHRPRRRRLLGALRRR
jgi:hypothetical protein